MKIITENTDHAELIWPSACGWERLKPGYSPDMDILLRRLFGMESLYICDSNSPSDWKYLIVQKFSPVSQYDIVNELYHNNIALPHGILCVAGNGTKFHGFHERPWASPPGNIYLTASFAPNCPILNYGVGFMSLAAVSAVETIDSLPGLKSKAGIKWVNDILIDNAKVCGVLAHAQQEGEKVTSAVLGIGLNVLTTPNIESTPFVPQVTSLQRYDLDSKSISLDEVFAELIRRLHDNYQAMINTGYKILLDKYRSRSIVTGRKVQVCVDDNSSEVRVLQEGVVERIGDGLELYLEDHTEPVVRGRLILSE